MEQVESSSSWREEMLAQTQVVLVRRHQIQAGFLLKESQQDFLMEWVEGVRNEGGKDDLKVSSPHNRKRTLLPIT